MNLKFVEQYCSIKDLNEISIPEFVVLTGLNGAGKTHLLKAMACKSIQLTDGINYLNNISYVNFSETQIYDQSYSDNVNKSEEKLVNEMIDNYRRTGELNVVTTMSLDYSNRSLPSEIKANIEQMMKEMNVTYDKLDISMYKYWKTSYKVQNQPFEMFKLSEIFTRYYEAKLKNEFKEYRKDSSALSIEEFDKLYGQEPLKVLNSYLSDLNKDFEICYDIPSEFDLQHRVCIKNRKTGDKINFTDLSTGEKTFLRVLLVAFSNDLGILSKPDVILLDEVDSGLHPSMMKEFLEYINRVFVKKLKIQVIITTHSPTTVALVDENSLFFVDKNMPRLSKISKKDAISKLTSELSFLRIDYEANRQVFVESEDDEKIYREIYGILLTNNCIKKNISLTFIGSGMNSTPNSGNCNSVKKFASELLKNGNSSVFGIIDFDNKNTDKENVFVLSNNNKYSIETCVLDPVLVGMYLIREGHSQKYSFSFKTFTSLRDATQQDFQLISDIVVNKLGFDTNKKTQIKYVNGYKIDVSKEMMEYNGHDLEKLYKEKFDELKSKKLKIEIVKKVINEYSKYCPIDFVDIFNKIISNK